MKSLVFALTILMPVLSVAQSWERITLNINHQTGVELLEFSETYKMVYKRKELGLESRLDTRNTIFGFGYNFFLSDKLLINPNLGLGIMEHQNQKGLGMGLNLQLAYSFFDEMNYPVYISGSFGKNLETNSPSLKSISFGLGAKVYEKSGLDENWKNRPLILTCGPVLTFQEETYWGICLTVSYSIGSISEFKSPK